MRFPCSEGLSVTAGVSSEMGGAFRASDKARNRCVTHCLGLLGLYRRRITQPIPAPQKLPARDLGDGTAEKTQEIGGQNAVDRCVSACDHSHRIRPFSTVAAIDNDPLRKGVEARVPPRVFRNFERHIIRAWRFVGDREVEDPWAVAAHDDGARPGLVVVGVAAAPFVVEADDGAVGQIVQRRQFAQVLRSSSVARKARSSSGRSASLPAKRVLRSRSW